MSEAVLKRLAAQFPDDVISTHSQAGDDTAVIRRDHVLDVATWLRDDPKNAFDLMRDVTAVDYLNLGRTPRFEVVYHFLSLKHKKSFRLKIPLEQDDLTMPSLSNLWAAGRWGEREVWDMFGVTFEGHPDLRRILLYEEFEGHPLRKDYPKRASQPRLDLLKPERDSLGEYEDWEKSRKDLSS